MTTTTHTSHSPRCDPQPDFAAAAGALPAMLLDGTVFRSVMGIELDFPKGLFVLLHVMLQQTQKRLGLLRAQIDALEVGDIDDFGGVLFDGAELQKEVPDVQADLHA